MQPLRHHTIAALAALLLALFASSAKAAYADTPGDPSCLGTDVSGVAQVLQPLGSLIVRNQAPMNDNVLLHLQGDESKGEPTNCPDNGFPTPSP